MTGWPASSSPAAQFEVAALRTAFPEYTFNLIRNRDEKPRFKAVSRDGGNPYCLISEDAREIWRELRGEG